MNRITVAGVAHAPVAARLQVEFNAEFESPTPPYDVLVPRFRALIDSPAAFVLLAGDPDDPEGHAVVTLRPTVYSDGPLAVLDELYVRPALRGGGIGSALLECVIAEVRLRGGSGSEMHINVDEVDADARRFYERHGFFNIEPGADYRMLLYIREL